MCVLHMTKWPCYRGVLSQYACTWDVSNLIMDEYYWSRRKSNHLLHANDILQDLIQGRDGTCSVVVAVYFLCRIY